MNERFTPSDWLTSLLTALIGPQRLHVCRMHGQTSVARELCLRGERVTWIIQLRHRRGGSTSSPPRCSVSVCVREAGMSKHLAWLQINENHCGLKFVWNRYAQNLASQLQLTKCQVLSGFSFCVLPMLVFCAALISNWERGKINSKKKRGQIPDKLDVDWWELENVLLRVFHFKSFIRNINLSVGHRGGLIG